MNDLQRLRAWLCELRDKRQLNTLAEQINVDRRTIQRILNRKDYHPRYDTFLALKEVMDSAQKRKGGGSRRKMKESAAFGG